MTTTTIGTPLTMMQGKTFRVTFAQTDSAGTATSLVGWGARFQVLRRPDGDVLLSVDDTTLDPSSPTQEACIVMEPSGQTGHVSVRLGADQTAAITRTGVYDASVYLKNDPTEVQPLSSGTLTLLQIGD